MENETKVLVTGVTGFVGAHTAIALLNKGYQVTGSLRSMKRADSIKAAMAPHTDHVENLSFVEADLLNADDWDKATQGMDYVMHVASPFTLEQPDDEMVLIRPAKEGTLNVLKAAEKNGVKRVVQTSSFAAIGYGHINRPAKFDETYWTDVTNKPGTTPYVRSKAIAEKAAWDFVNQPEVKLELAVINPVAILGPVLEKDFGTSAAIVKQMLAGEIPATPRMGFEIVDVRDVAYLHVAAMEKPEAAGNRYLASNGFRWFKDVADLLRKEMPAYKSKLPKFDMPNFMVRLMSYFRPELKGILPELGKTRIADNSKARKELNWNPISPEEAILSTARSLIEHGVIQAR